MKITINGRKASLLELVALASSMPKEKCPTCGSRKCKRARDPQGPCRAEKEVTP